MKQNPYHRLTHADKAERGSIKINPCAIVAYILVICGRAKQLERIVKPINNRMRALLD